MTCDFKILNNQKLVITCALYSTPHSALILSVVSSPLGSYWPRVLSVRHLPSVSFCPKLTHTPPGFRSGSKVRWVKCKGDLNSGGLCAFLCILMCSGCGGAEQQFGISCPGSEERSVPWPRYRVYTSRVKFRHRDWTSCANLHSKLKTNQIQARSST